MMSYRNFIILLITYLLIVLGTMLCERFGYLPPEAAKVKPRIREDLDRERRGEFHAIGLTNVLILIIGLAGFVGLFFLWPPARWLFGASILANIVIGKIFSFPRYVVRSPVAEVFVELEFFLGGVIVSLIFFGPARTLFLDHV